MNKRSKFLVAGGVAATLAAGGAGLAVATGGDDSEGSISGKALDSASAAALESTGGGQVTDTEVGDEESFYEVEVALDDGSQVDVQLDRDFNVVGEEAEGPDEDEGASDD